MGKLRSLHYVHLLVLPGIIVNRLDCINFYLCTHELSGVLINQNIHRKQISHSPGMHFEWVTLGIFRIGRFRTLMFRHTEKVTVLLHWCLLNMCLFNNAVLVSFNQPSQYEIILFSLINTDLLCCQNSVLGKSWVNKSLGQGICFRADNAQEQVDFALCHNLIHFHKSYLFLIQYPVGQGVVMKFDLLNDSHILRGWDMSLHGYSSCADDATNQHSLPIVVLCAYQDVILFLTAQTWFIRILIQNIRQCNCYSLHLKNPMSPLWHRALPISYRNTRGH